MYSRAFPVGNALFFFAGDVSLFRLPRGKLAFAQRSGAMKAPVGNALFVGIKVGRTTLAKVMPYMLMYYAAIILGLLLVTYIPAVSMVLPQVTGLV